MKSESEKISLSKCPKGCECQIVIDNGKVLIPRDVIALLGKNNTDVDRKQSEIDSINFLSEYHKIKDQSDWASRVNLAIGSMIKKWLEETSLKNLPEINSPEFPPPLKLIQESWETNKEFEDRIALSRADRQKEIERIQADYKARVNKRNYEVQKMVLLQAEKEKQLNSKKKELLSVGLRAVNLNIEAKNASFDQGQGVLLLDVSVENESPNKFIIKDAPQQLRKEALTAPSSLVIKPDFYISDSGQFGIKTINIESAGVRVSGLPSSQNNSSKQPSRLATIDVPTPNLPVLVQQSSITVDKNQVEQILYREENESLRKRLEEQRKAQELILTEETRKAATETAKLREEAETAKTRQRELESQLASLNRTPLNYVKELDAHALIIGNASYGGNSKLSNPINDAKAMTGVLRGLGFKVTESLDSDRAKLVNVLSQFSRSAANADITLLFYAGHGVQISGTNYMLPVDLNLNDLSQVPLQGVSLNSVVEQYLPGKTKLVFLDACRDNPLMQTASRSVSRGLAPINVSEGTLISYSTKDGQVAQDGDGKNSPFTTALLKHLGDPDDIAVVLRKVREEVLKNTGGKQQPWEYGSLTGGALVLSAIKPTK